MHCPRCGHRQNSDEIRFCTKCGLEISDVKALLAPEARESNSKKRKMESRKAARQGMMLVLSGFIVILLLAMLREFVPVSKVFFALAVLVFIIGGAIRMMMPSLFGRDDPDEVVGRSAVNGAETSVLSGAAENLRSLTEAEYRPPLDFRGNAYDTNELAAPPSVAEDTTKNLQKEIGQTEVPK